MQKKHSLISSFFYFFRWYLVLLALAAHIVLAGIIILVLVLGPEHSIDYAKRAGQKVKTYAKSQLSHSQKLIQINIENLSKSAEKDSYSFRILPDARTETLGYGRVLQIGPEAEFTSPSLAAKAAKDGDVIEIAGGNYPGDTIVWTKNDLLIRSIGGVAKLDAKETRLAEDKAIWVIRGNNVRIENIEFANARSKDRNGAGIRAEGNKLEIISCYFHDNESGVMASNNRHAQLRIENSEFARNGHQSGQAHQVYVGTIDKFILTGSYVHETQIGSAVKTRARMSSVLYNRIVDESHGSSNYTIDLSNGGEAYIFGNILQQGPTTENYTLVTYAPEGKKWDKNQLFIAHNTIVNDRSGGNFIRNHTQVNAQVFNNLLIGDGSPLEGPAILIGNMVDHGKGIWGSIDESLGGLPGSNGNQFTENVGIVDRFSYNYQLTPESPAIDSAARLTPEIEKVLKPMREYRHPLHSQARLLDKVPDVGAYEYAPDNRKKQ